MGNGTLQENNHSLLFGGYVVLFQQILDYCPNYIFFNEYHCDCNRLNRWISERSRDFSFQRPEWVSLEKDMIAYKKNDEAFKLIIGESFKNGRIIADDNLLIFELYCYNMKENVNSFDVSVILNIYNTFWLVWSVIEVNIDGYNGLSY